MNCFDVVEPHPGETCADCRIRLPLGLLGFEQFNNFSLVTNPQEEPFLRLQALDEPHLAFLAMSPLGVILGYEPKIPDADADFLELRRSMDQLIFNLVSLRGDGRATINLKGPIVLNRLTLVAKQVILVNASSYSVAHPLHVRAY
jgi:flagellar assembly factor FliW